MRLFICVMFTILIRHFDIHTNLTQEVILIIAVCTAIMQDIKEITRK